MIPLLASAQSPARPTSGQKVVLITGATSGLGREVAVRLAAGGAHVIAHGRDTSRGREVVDEITKAGKGSARFYAADLSSNADIRRFATAILADYQRLDVLVNNAGIGTVPAEREVTKEGIESRMQVNYLSGVLLTRLLLPRLLSSAPSRVVNVSSLSASPINFDDVMMEQGFSGGRAYGQSKLSQVMFTIDLAAELEGKGVTVNALHPATMMPTGMVLRTGRPARSTIDEGARAVLHLIQDAGVGTGQFYVGETLGRANAQAYDVDARARLKRLSEQLVGIR
ncbi:MAG: SDR family NAD(P)-dependent oxidoreductase [Cytophagaceae bacterium]|nr:SDR family NAD(P)-dependent oxidoreductase [Gemmatimonadaceae bacterium]